MHLRRAIERDTIDCIASIFDIVHRKRCEKKWAKKRRDGTWLFSLKTLREGHATKKSIPLLPLAARRRYGWRPFSVEVDEGNRAAEPGTPVVINYCDVLRVTWGMSRLSSSPPREFHTLSLCILLSPACFSLRNNFIKQLIELNLLGEIYSICKRREMKKWSN